MFYDEKPERGGMAGKPLVELLSNRFKVDTHVHAFMTGRGGILLRES